ncbi:MAG: hypothetical protein IJD04_03455, partial [Desulfovibrionaceae bacterium]|nr:hypothetical protein [Desulfovibrionaceae bacterium]
MLTSLPDITYAQIFGQLASLNLEVYSPSAYIFPSRQSKYIDSRNLTQAGREQGIRRLMGINLLKRLESSVYSFKATLERVHELIENTLIEVVTYAAGRTAKSVLSINNDGDFDDDDQNIDHLMSGGKIEVNLADIDYQTWIRQMRADQKIISALLQEVGRISDNTDSKLQALFKLIDDKQKAPINAGNRKLLIFTAFSDTAEYLYEKVSRYCLDKYGLNSALVTGTGKNKTT